MARSRRRRGRQPSTAVRKATHPPIRCNHMVEAVRGVAFNSQLQGLRQSTGSGTNVAPTAPTRGKHVVGVLGCATVELVAAIEHVCGAPKETTKCSPVRSSGRAGCAAQPVWLSNGSAGRGEGERADLQDCGCRWAACRWAQLLPQRGGRHQPQAPSPPPVGLPSCTTHLAALPPVGLVQMCPAAHLLGWCRCASPTHQWARPAPCRSWPPGAAEGGRQLREG